MANDRRSFEELEIQIEELKNQNKLLLQNGIKDSHIKENSYRLLFKNSLDSFAICQMVFKHELPVDFIYLKVNQAFERLTGLYKVIDCGTTGLLYHIQEDYRWNKRL